MVTEAFSPDTAGHQTPVDRIEDVLGEIIVRLAAEIAGPLRTGGKPDKGRDQCDTPCRPPRQT